MKRKYFDWEDNVPLEPCSGGRNHIWDEFAKGGYVIQGFLSGGKQGIGERCGRVCGRLFVEKSICPKVNENNTELGVRSGSCMLSGSCDLVVACYWHDIEQNIVTS
jgi:hypothetical protein